jgi:hypothetical protein
MFLEKDTAPRAPNLNRQVLHRERRNYDYGIIRRFATDGVLKSLQKKGQHRVSYGVLGSVYEQNSAELSAGGGHRAQATCLSMERRSALFDRK